MSCPDCHLHLQSLLDGDEAVLEETEVNDHLNQCPVCRERLGASLLLLEGLRRFPKPVPLSGLNQRIAAAVLADRQDRLTWRRRQTLLAVAAVFLLAPFLSVYLLVQAEPERPGRVRVKFVFPQGFVAKALALAKARAKTKGEDIVEVRPAKTLPLRPQMEESRASWTALVERFIHINQPNRLVQTVSLPLEMGSVEPLTGLEPFSRPLAHTTQGAHHAAQGFSLGSQVFSNTTRRALSYFSRSLPPISAPPKRPL